MQEAKVADTSNWVTFTYDSPPLDGNLLPTLHKPDLQKFFKRLRKIKRGFSTQKIKYYACGEYGTKTERPHYHAVIFNSTAEHIKKVWDGFHSHVCQQTGNIVVLGFTTFDVVNERTVQYTAKYMSKGKLIPKWLEDKRVPEFQLFSKDLGINFVTNATRTFYNNDPTRNSVSVDGFRKALPRYFYNKLVVCPVFRLAKAYYAQSLAAEKHAEQLSGWERNKTFHQTFESYRYTQKQHALTVFRDNLAKRKKL